MKRVSQPKWQRDMNKYVDDFSTNALSSSELGSCLGAFFKHLQEETMLSLNTIRLRYNTLSYFTDWLNSCNISDLSLVDASTLRKFLLYCKNERNQGGNMLKCSKNAIRHFFSYLFNAKIIANNPTLNLRAPTRCPVKEKTILNEDEILALFEAPISKLNSLLESSNAHLCNERRIFTTTRDAAIIAVLLSTGIRTQELCDITLSDINLKTGTIDINGKGNHLYVKRHRTVFINITEVIEAINNFLDLRNLHKCKEIFCSWDDFPLKNATINAIVRKYAEYTNIKRKVTPMIIRHTFCTHLTNNEADNTSLLYSLFTGTKATTNERL